MALSRSIGDLNDTAATRTLWLVSSPLPNSGCSGVGPTTVSPIKDVRARPAEHGGQSVHIFGRHLNRNASTNGQAAMRPVRS